MIKDRSAAFDGVSVVEVGSGSSALLYRLAIDGVLKQGVGVEISATRFNFAEKCKSDGGFMQVSNINDNFVNVDFPKTCMDLFVVIDNTFTHLYPENETYPDLLIKAATETLRKGGMLLLDIINYANRLRHVELQQWNKFPETDPFAYGIYSHKIFDNINRTESIFVKRNGGGESRKVGLSKVYNFDEISSSLRKFGFIISGIFSDFNESPYCEANSERLVIVAELL